MGCGMMIKVGWPTCPMHYDIASRLLTQESPCTGKKRTFPEISFHEMSTNVHLNAQGNVGKGKITG